MRSILSTPPAAGTGIVVVALLGDLRAAVVGVRGQPGREGAGFFRVVGAQDARDVRVVGGVAVVFVVEERAAQGGVAVCGVC